MNTLMNVLVEVLRWELGAGVVIGILFCACWGGEAFSFSRQSAASESDSRRYEWWDTVCKQLTRMENRLIGFLVLVLILFLVTAVIFVALTIWFPPSWL